MAYAKFQGSGLFTGQEILDASQVLITTEKGIIEAIIPETEAGDNIQKVNGMLSPGFVNCHCHLELSHMKGLLPEKTGLVGFVTGVLQQRAFSPEKIQEAIATGEQEMIRNGIVAVGDICNTTHTLVQKTAGNLAYFNFTEVSGFVPAGAPARFDQALSTYTAFAGAGLPGAITAHAPYSVSKALFELINTHAAGKLVSVHNQETPEEDAFFRDGVSDFRKLYDLLGVDLSFYTPPGSTSLQHWLPLLSSPSQLLLVHNTCTTATDVRFAQEQAARQSQQLYWTLCPNANLYIENRLPPVDLLRAEGCTLTLGTDSLASNWSLDILGELRTLHTHFPHLPLAELLQWATLNGATALQLQHQFGSFDKGKQPGVLEIEKGLAGVRTLC
jgi:cytosine/adenosine deaminase-related metal-dependent hydrolase